MSTTLNRHLSVLSSSTRRALLYKLLEGEEGWQQRSGLQVVQPDGNSGPSPIELHHIHLPKLAAAGIIEWNQSTGNVTKGPEFAAIEPLLTAVSTHYDVGDSFS